MMIQRRTKSAIVPKTLRQNSLNDIKISGISIVPYISKPTRIACSSLVRQAKQRIQSCSYFTVPTAHYNSPIYTSEEELNEYNHNIDDETNNDELTGKGTFVLDTDRKELSEDNCPGNFSEFVERKREKKNLQFQDLYRPLVVEDYIKRNEIIPMVEEDDSVPCEPKNNIDDVVNVNNDLKIDISSRKLRPRNIRTNPSSPLRKSKCSTITYENWKPETKTIEYRNHFKQNNQINRNNYNQLEIERRERKELKGENHFRPTNRILFGSKILKKQKSEKEQRGTSTRNDSSSTLTLNMQQIQKTMSYDKEMKGLQKKLMKHGIEISVKTLERALLPPEQGVINNVSGVEKRHNLSSNLLSHPSKWKNDGMSELYAQWKKLANIPNVPVKNTVIEQSPQQMMKMVDKQKSYNNYQYEMYARDRPTKRTIAFSSIVDNGEDSILATEKLKTN
ncbi:hypothetical protein SNEBB_006437 [Seison nebaliae]|nr:hypothetical protein SNEBB_006437 [Seison nebaliae]